MTTELTEDEWKAKLTPEQYHVLREAGTEPAWTGALLSEKRPGKFVCGACGQMLFDAANKFESGSGWPSFDQAVSNDAVELIEDKSYGMRRVEVRCSNCHSHLGHVFDDGPRETTGERFCMNSLALEFEPEASETS
jgi:peptide-methionine (R)-S-oxide reductase